MIPALDVSHWRGKIDWKKVAKAGCQVAIIKATQGQRFVDDRFEENVVGAKAAGILTGVYHWLEPDGAAGAQFKHFWSVAEKHLKGMFVALDVEGDSKNQLPKGVTGADYVKTALAWLGYLKKKTGKQALVYTYPSFNNTYLDGKLGAYPLWAAAYPKITFTNGKLDNWQGWSDLVCWQFSDKGSWPGIAGTNCVDLDMVVDEMALRRLIV